MKFRAADSRFEIVTRGRIKQKVAETSDLAFRNRIASATILKLVSCLTSGAVVQKLLDETSGRIESHKGVYRSPAVVLRKT